MKILSFVLIFISSVLYCQNLDSSNIKINYIAKFLTDTTNINSSKEELTSLWIGSKSSLFKSDQKAIYDSLAFETAKKSLKNPVDGKVVLDFSNLRKSYFTPEVYKADNKITVFDKIFNIYYEFESQNKINWNIINETKQIATYKCRKAIGKYHNKNIIAWFTDEIPFSEGPYAFKGLPGLIVEAYDEKNYFHFLLVGLKNIKQPIISIRNTIKTDYEKFLKKRTDFQNDPAGAYFSATGKTVNKDQIERVTKLHKSRNNHLD